MGNETAAIRKKRRLDACSTVRANGASSSASSEGYVYDEIGREEQLSPERVRQIVRKGLAWRIVDDETKPGRRKKERPWGSA